MKKQEIAQNTHEPEQPTKEGYMSEDAFHEAMSGMNAAAERLDDLLFEFMQGLNPARDEINRTLYEIARMRILLDAVEALIRKYIKEL